MTAATQGIPSALAANVSSLGHLFHRTCGGIRATIQVSLIHSFGYEGELIIVNWLACGSEDKRWNGHGDGLQLRMMRNLASCLLRTSFFGTRRNEYCEKD